MSKMRVSALSPVPNTEKQIKSQASSDSENIDCKILLTLWPKIRKSVQKLLKEEGYEEAKLLFICICRNEKTSKKFVYSGKHTALENKDDLCIHCGKNGYLEYYYLGISTKVKT